MEKELDTWKIIKIMGVHLLVVYLLIVFIVGGFDIFTSTSGFVRLIMVVAYVFTAWLIIDISIDNGHFKSTPHKEKVEGIKKYKGELEEELALYNDAMELQKKVHNLQSKL